NIGGTAAENVNVELPLPPALNFFWCIPPQGGSCENNEGNVTASVGTLAPGSSLPLFISASVLPIASQSSASATATVSTTSSQVGSGTNQASLNITLNPVSGPPTGDTLTVVVTPQGAVLAGTNGGGAFRSSDGGANWTAASGGLTSLFVRSFAVTAG